MQCKYCGNRNAEEEHRCNRCGRRVQTLPVSQTYPASRAAPALALAEQPAAIVEVEDAPPLAERAPVPQRLGFEEVPSSNVIPFESYTAHRIQPDVSPPAVERAASAQPVAGPVADPRGAAVRPKTRRRSATEERNDLQAGLDFLVPPPQGPRTLKTQVEAVIYCDADVATPKHRAIAAAIDGGMIFVGFSLFLFTFHLMGGMFHFSRQTIPFFIGVFGTLAMFYSVLWIWAGRETAGMRWTGLRVIDFDGFPADRRNRLLRSIGACLSLCAGGIGLLWSLVDEEKLTWHDHMSKTFPTIQESNRSFLRSGR